MREKLIELLDQATEIFRFNAWENTDKIADHLIANGVTIQKWIPVTERLPKEEDADPTGCVLAIHISDKFARRWEIEAINRSPEYFTHWMPLPTPPKEE